MEPRLPEKNTATRNSLEVTLKALGGFMAGGLYVVWTYPGLREALLQYASENWLNVAVTIGVPSAATGLINLYFDWRKKGLKNY